LNLRPTSAFSSTTGRQNGLDLCQSARLFGLLDMALADGYIDSFDTKYTYAFWRPITAMRTADSDGNPRTSADPTWTPLRPTPPIPDYDSAHSVEGGAAAAVLRGYFGADPADRERRLRDSNPGWAVNPNRISSAAP
jgi:hypothetical protein